MVSWWWIVLASLVGAAVGAAAGAWISQRAWKAAKKLSARARGHEHLVELGQVAGGLAHEIKNPLSTINVNLKLLSEDISQYNDDQSQRILRRLAAVQSESARLKDILDDFLRFAGRMELTPTVVDLRRVVSELCDFFEPQATAARVVMRTSLPEFPVRANVDENLIKQALLNLMLNAVQAMPQGGELLIRLSSQRGQAVLEVIDTGAGIAKEDLARVFDVYYSTKKRGMGLGLPTTRRIIREHAGVIRAESEPGKGTRFITSLPLVETQR